MFYSMRALWLHSSSIYGRLIKNTVDKDLEILALRHQVRLLQRHRKSKPRCACFEKLLLAVLAVKLKARLEHGSKRLDQYLLLFKLQTVLKWHRALVRRKWTVRSARKPGRPRISPEPELLVVRLARENPRWGPTAFKGSCSKWAVASVPPLSVRYSSATSFRPRHNAERMVEAGVSC